MLTDPKIRSLFTAAGHTLTPTEEHLACKAQAAGFDWSKLIQLGIQIALTVLAAFGIKVNQPDKAKMRAAVAAGCDHYVTCCDVFEATCAANCKAAQHCCACMDGGYG